MRWPNTSPSAPTDAEDIATLCRHLGVTTVDDVELELTRDVLAGEP